VRREQCTVELVDLIHPAECDVLLAMSVAASTKLTLSAAVFVPTAAAHQQKTVTTVYIQQTTNLFVVV